MKTGVLETSSEKRVKNSSDLKSGTFGFIPCLSGFSGTSWIFEAFRTYPRARVAPHESVATYRCLGVFT